MMSSLEVGTHRMRRCNVLCHDEKEEGAEEEEEDEEEAMRSQSFFEDFRPAATPLMERIRRRKKEKKEKRMPFLPLNLLPLISTSSLSFCQSSSHL